MPANEQDQHPQAAILRGYEMRDIRARVVIIWGAALMVSVPLIVFVLWFHFRLMAGDRYRGLTRPTIRAAFNAPTSEYPRPQLITVPGAQLQHLRQQEDVLLSSHGWINRTQNIIHIPIDQAMNLVLEQGLPVRQPGLTKSTNSEYELIIKRRLEREKSFREGKALEE